MAFRIAQISDAHLSPRVTLFEGNFDRVAEEIRAARPDLMIATGDLSLDGADRDEDLIHARDRHAAIGADWVAVPGNHDVGDEPLLGAKQPSSAERVARWTRILGTYGFVRDVPGWRVIGFDTQSLHSAPGQWAAIEAAVRGAGARRIALFQHKPLCEDRLTDARRNYWPVLPEFRSRLLALFAGGGPALVASGHVHQWWDRGVVDGIRQLWAPPTSFIIGPDFQWGYGERLLGWVEHLLHPDGTHEARLRQTPGLVPHDLGLMPEIYGAQRPAASPAGA
ncbi:MAG: metallophosphoesterase [Acetobacteraceae bacterium]|nr:metallophosphoesterase [Acetobacteraceae bacterium]